MVGIQVASNAGRQSLRLSSGKYFLSKMGPPKWVRPIVTTSQFFCNSSSSPPPPSSLNQLRSKDGQKLQLQEVVGQVNGNEVRIDFRRRFRCLCEIPDEDLSKYHKGVEVRFSKVVLTIDEVVQPPPAHLEQSRWRGQFGSEAVQNVLRHVQPSSPLIMVLGYTFLFILIAKFFKLALVIGIDLLVFSWIFVK